jgi:hypothetical protein
MDPLHLYRKKQNFRPLIPYFGNGRDGLGVYPLTFGTELFCFEQQSGSFSCYLTTFFTPAINDV